MDSANTSSSSIIDFQCFYLVGLEAREMTSSSASIIEAFVHNIQSGKTYYDAQTCFIGAAPVLRDQLPECILDHKVTWRDNGIDEDSYDTDEEDDANHELDDIAFYEFRSFDHKSTRHDKKSDTAAQKLTKTSQVTDKNPNFEGRPRLRTSAEVYNRLMWDGTFDVTDFVIGYEDRFLGVRETSLLSWKREVEDEAFVRVSSYLTRRKAHCFPDSVPSSSSFS
jgi:hypothetical protein